MADARLPPSPVADPIILGVVIFFGMTMGAVMTLFVVPACCQSLARDAGDSGGRHRGDRPRTGLRPGALTSLIGGAAAPLPPGVGNGARMLRPCPLSVLG